MDPIFRAGLPRSSASGNLPVGAAMLMQAGNSLVTMADRSVWLRTGVLAPASSYPAAARLEYLRAHNFSSVSPGSGTGGTTRRLATDGAGRYMLADGDTTNVRMSSDYGATWTNVAHGLGAFAATDVAYAGGTWLVVGNNGTTVVGNTSTNGTSFSGSFNIGSSVSLFSTATAQIAHSGTLFYVAVGGSDAANACWSSPTGLTGSWTNRTAAALGTSFALGAGGGKALVVISSSSGAHKCTDGASFTSTTLPFIAGTSARPAYIAGNFVVYQTSSAYALSSDLTTFTQYDMPAGTGIGYQWAVVGSRLIYLAASLSGIAYTSDGVNWDYQSASISAGGAVSDAFAADAQSMVYQASGVATAYRAASSVIASNYVGRSVLTYANSNIMNNPYLYYRVK